jgi:hypothetical protein
MYDTVFTAGVHSYDVSKASLGITTDFPIGSICGDLILVRTKDNSCNLCKAIDLPSNVPLCENTKCTRLDRSDGYEVNWVKNPKANKLDELENEIW